MNCTFRVVSTRSACSPGRGSGVVRRPRDTLLAFELAAWPRTVKRKAIETAKFYFFDTGVVRTRRRLPPASEASANLGEFFSSNDPSSSAARNARG